jgi:hypothetical protein
MILKGKGLINVDPKTLRATSKPDTHIICKLDPMQ